MDKNNEKALTRLRKSDRRFKFFLYLTLIVLFIVVVGSIAVGWLLFLRVQDIAQRIEDSQKGSLCILLIKPDNRTAQNVTSCVDNNRTKNSPKNLQFKDTNNNLVVKYPTPSSVAIRPKVKIDTHEESIPVIKVEEPICPAIETRINPITFKLDYRYIGVNGWQIAPDPLPECP